MVPIDFIDLDFSCIDEISNFSEKFDGIEEESSSTDSSDFIFINY